MGVVPTWPMPVTKVGEGLGAYGDRAAPFTGHWARGMLPGKRKGSEPKRWAEPPGEGWWDVALNRPGGV